MAVRPSRVESSSADRPWQVRCSRRAAVRIVGLSMLASSALSLSAHARTVTLEERIAAERAIAQVYWNHTLWPESNPDPKPSFEEVLSDAAIRARVEEGLRRSAALEKWWRERITPEQLQAEIDRIARETRAPEVVRELFDALGNDPARIAETLARPQLANRLLRRRYDRDDRFHGDVRRRAEAVRVPPTLVQLKCPLPAG